MLKRVKPICNVVCLRLLEFGGLLAKFLLSGFCKFTSISQKPLEAWFFFKENRAVVGEKTSTSAVHLTCPFSGCLTVRDTWRECTSECWWCLILYRYVYNFSLCLLLLNVPADITNQTTCYSFWITGELFWVLDRGTQVFLLLQN